MSSSSLQVLNPARNVPHNGTRRQGIFWLLTVPHPCELCDRLPEQGLPNGVVWLKGQLERGEQGGYLHYQLVAAFSKKVSLNGVKRVFGTGIHAELSRSAAANSYVCKESTRAAPPWELGAKPIRVNSKTDYDSIWTAAQSGDLMSIPARIRVVSYRTLRAIAADFAIPMGEPRTVWCFFGSTGTGKSRRAWEEAGLDAYPKDPRSKFWCGYKGQRNVIFDEFRGGIDVAHLLRWFDRYPVHLEVKGSSLPLEARNYWITSNLHPARWYPELDGPTLDALMRRMTLVDFDLLPE